MKLRMRYVTGFLAAVLVSVLVESIEAHDPGFSTANVTLGAEKVDAIVTFSQEEITTYLKNTGENKAGEILLVGGKGPTSQSVEQDEENNTIFRFSFSSGDADTVRIEAPVVDALLPGHRQHLLVRDANRDFVAQQLFKAGAFFTTVRNNRERSDSVGNQSAGDAVFPFWTVWLSLMTMSMAAYVLYRTRNAVRSSALNVSA